MAKGMVQYLHFRILKFPLIIWRLCQLVVLWGQPNHDELQKMVHETIQWTFPPSFYSFLLWFILFILTNTGLILQVGRCRKNFVGPQYDPPSNSGDRPSSPLAPGPKPRYFQLLQEVLHLRGNLHWRIPRSELLATLRKTFPTQCEKHDMCCWC